MKLTRLYALARDWEDNVAFCRQHGCDLERAETLEECAQRLRSELEKLESQTKLPDDPSQF